MQSYANAPRRLANIQPAAQSPSTPPTHAPSSVIYHLSARVLPTPTTHRPTTTPPPLIAIDHPLHPSTDPTHTGRAVVISCDCVS